MYYDPAHGFLHELFSNVGGSLNFGDDMDITLDDEAATNITAGTCAVDNPSAPEPISPNRRLFLWWTASIPVATGRWSLAMTSPAPWADSTAGASPSLFAIATATEARTAAITARPRECRPGRIPTAMAWAMPVTIAPQAANSNQADQDGDGIGNECDNCPTAANADQADSRRRQPGRRVLTIARPSRISAQADGDGDGFGDRCDTDSAVFNPGDQNPDGAGPQATGSCGACGAGVAMPLVFRTPANGLAQVTQTAYGLKRKQRRHRRWEKLQQKPIRGTS